MSTSNAKVLMTSSYEPDGNVPPDLLINGRIAIKVTRLNEYVVVKGNPQMKLQGIIRKILQDRSRLTTQELSRLFITIKSFE